MKISAALLLALGAVNQAAAQSWLDNAPADDFSILSSAIVAENLDDAIIGMGMTTAFGPVDSAFDGVDLTGVDMVSVLSYHILPGSAVNSTEVLAILAQEPEACIDVETALDGTFVRVHLDNGVIKVNNATVIMPDIFGTNGVLHGIDSILSPDDYVPCPVAPKPKWIEIANATGMFDTLIGAVASTNVTVDCTCEKTIFGPTDAAFANIDLANVSVSELADVLKYHIVKAEFSYDLAYARVDLLGGCVEIPTFLDDALMKIHIKNGTLMTNDATINMDYADLMGNDGVFHGVDSVILPSSFTPCPVVDSTTSAPTATPEKSFIQVATDKGVFSTLNDTIQAYNVSDLLATLGGDITVFGPTDKAFEGVTIEPVQLVLILVEHVILGRLTATDIMQMLAEKPCIEIPSASTHPDASKRFLKVAKMGDMIMVNDIAHIDFDLINLSGPDGILHGIDAVLPFGSFTPCMDMMDMMPSPAPSDDDSGAFGVSTTLAAVGIALAGFFM